MRLAFFREKRYFPRNPCFLVNFNAFTFIYEGFRVLSAAFVRTLLFATCHTWALNTYTHLTALRPGLPGLAGTSASEVTTLWRYTNLFSIIIITRKVIPIWIFLKQETVASAAPYASLHLAPGRQPRQHPTTQFFTGRMPFLPPNQQRQSMKASCTK